MEGELGPRLGPVGHHHRLLLEEEDFTSPKRAKLNKEEDDIRPQPLLKQTPKCSDFMVSHLEDFYKPNPPFRLPAEIGSFSFDSNGDMVLDRSGLRYFSQPPRLGLDLKIGYDSFEQKLNQTPDLRDILTWVSHNWTCFQTKQLNSQTSVESKTDECNNGRDSLTTAAGGPTEIHQRPDNLLTDFICWRGLMTKLLCTPYNKSESWKLIATRHHGTIYLRELETEEKKEKESNMSSMEKQMCYWGLKFEDYMTRKGPSVVPPPPPSSSTTHSSHFERPGTVNSKEAFCCVVRTRLNSHSLVMAGEIDCIDQASREKTPQSYIELKTSRVIYTDRNKASFKRHKLMKWWAQSFLIGIPKIVCGFRDNEGIVQHLQSFKTVDIPRESQNDLGLWQGNVCLNFLDELLKWIKETVAKDDYQTMYIIEWKHPFTHISATCSSTTLELHVLPEWFIKKTLPDALSTHTN